MVILWLLGGYLGLGLHFTSWLEAERIASWAFHCCRNVAVSNRCHFIALSSPALHTVATVVLVVAQWSGPRLPKANQMQLHNRSVCILRRGGCYRANWKWPLKLAILPFAINTVSSVLGVNG